MIKSSKLGRVLLGKNYVTYYFLGFIDFRFPLTYNNTKVIVLLKWR
jgi:hypothetical protein